MRNYSVRKANLDYSTRKTFDLRDDEAPLVEVSDKALAVALLLEALELEEEKPTSQDNGEGRSWNPYFVPERNKERAVANTAKIRKQMEVLGSCGNPVGIVA